MDGLILIRTAPHGDVVRYLPKLSGFKSNTKLVVESCYYKEIDDLSNALGVGYTPKWVYHFEGTAMAAIEDDIELFTHTFEIVK